MKHTTALYTCIGLMGAAAIMGFADYQSASKKGELKDLYAEEPVVNPVVAPKEIDLEDYSRGPIEPDEAANDDTAQPSKKAPQKTKRPKKSLPPPPPPPPPAPKKSIAVTEMDAVPVVPETPPPPPEVAISLNETPPPPPEAVTPVAPPPPPPAEVNEEMSFKYFSRGPLPKKKNAKSGKKQ